MKKIIKLHNFGSFKAFDATDDLPPFTNYNLFFAYNGAGKTTFSRFLNFLSKGNSLPQEFKLEGYLEDFEIEKEDGTLLTSFEDYQKDIKVFNSDFISNEVDFEANKLSAISVDFGAGRKEIKKQILRLESLLKKLYETNEKGELTNKVIYSKQYSEKKDELENLQKDEACNIRQELNLDSNKYKITHFKNNIQTYKKDTPNISDEELQQAQATFKQNATKEINYIDETNVILTEDMVNKINAILKKSVKRKNTSFKQEIVDWIEKGKTFNIQENGKRCYFCNSLIFDWEQRLKEINEIVSKDNEYEDFEQEFNNVKTDIMNKIKKLNTVSFVKSTSSEISELEFLDTYRPQVKKLKEDISLYKDLYQDMLNLILEALTNKEKDFTNVGYDDFNYEKINNLKLKIQEFVSLLKQNNNDVKLFEQKQQEAFSTVVNYHIQKTKEEREKLEEEINFYCAQISKADRISKKIATKLNKLNIQLENQSAAIETIEKYIETIFTTKKFKFKYVEENKNYQIVREDGHEAKHLSEGEKTVIAFSYFLTTLDDKNIVLKNTIVVVDDPVSSLDQNYLYNLLTLLYRRFKAISKFKKLFVLTHNFYFFKKLRNMLLLATKDHKERLQIYKIEKNKETSVITAATQDFITYQSEYLSKVFELKEMYQNSSLSESISIGVAIRKVFEIFLSYQAPCETTLFRKFEAVFKGESTAKYRYLEGIANASCHTDEIDDLDALEPFKLSVGKNEIKQLFSFIREIDERHADALNLPKIIEQDLEKDS